MVFGLGFSATYHLELKTFLVSLVWAPCLVKVEGSVKLLSYQTNIRGVNHLTRGDTALMVLGLTATVVT
jgi:hypothetical protein